MDQTKHHNKEHDNKVLLCAANKNDILLTYSTLKLKKKLLLHVVQGSIFFRILHIVGIPDANRIPRIVSFRLQLGNLSINGDAILQISAYSDV